ncbi:MAG: glycosyltransferase [Desulfovibrio sp.]|nr:glycosyltransferase [Desulfovibrio sp.]
MGTTYDASVDYLCSIVMCSYNNAQYLEQAIASCLCQKTDFPFQLIIADDASTDGSQDIIRSYAQKHSNIFPIFQTGHNCVHKNYTDAFNAARTPYVALCDGDDFWIGEEKLQLQVGFLREHPDFSVCAHKTEQFVYNAQDPARYKPIYKRNASRRTQETGVLYADEIADNYYLHTSSYVFRWLFREGLPSYWDRAMSNDLFFLLLHAAEGKIKYFDRTLSVWRRHENGMTWLQTAKPSAYVREKWEDFIILQTKMDEFFEGRFHYQLLERVRFALHSLTKECIATGDYSMLTYIVRRFYDYFEEFRDKYEVLVEGYRLVDPLPRPTALCNLADCTFSAPGAAQTEQKHRNTVGGNIPLDLAAIPPAADSIWQLWTQGREYACFYNAISALEALIAQQGTIRVWSPKFCAADQLRMKQKKLYSEMLCYDVSPDCGYVLSFLEQLQSGDIVLTPCFFGRPLPCALTQALERRSDVIWVEDRTCALDAPSSSAPWQLYSPPTVLGVPDGGILMGPGVSSWLPLPHNDNEEDMLHRLAPAFLNYEFPDRAFLAASSTRDKEDMFICSREAMSLVSRGLLERISYGLVSSARKRNWATLYSRLQHLALWDMPQPEFTPYAFPLLLPEGKAACRLSSFLVDEGFLCPVPYGMGASFRSSPILSERIAALPLSHNYDSSDMHRLADAVLRILQH